VVVHGNAVACKVHRAKLLSTDTDMEACIIHQWELLDTLCSTVLLRMIPLSAVSVHIQRGLVGSYKGK